MSLSSLLYKVAKGNKLSNLELIALQDSLRSIDTVLKLAEGWIASGTTIPSMPELIAKRADLDIPPGNPYMVNWGTLVTGEMFDIPHSTWTALDLTDSRLTIRQDSPCIVRLDGTKIYSNFPTSFIKFDGRVLFNTHGTGVRHVAIAYYTSADVLIERRMLGAVASLGVTSGTPVPLSGVTRLSLNPLSTDPQQYFKVEVVQTSTTTLGVGGIDISMSRYF